MRSLWFAVVGLILLNAISLQASAGVAPQGTYPIRLPVTITKSNPVTTITVGGRTVQAIVDTGGDVDGVLTLSKEVIDGVGALSLDTVVTNDCFGNEFKRPRFRVPVASIGGQSFQNVVVVQARDRPIGDGPAVPNAIGRQFLSQYFVVVNYAGAIITLWPPDTNALRCGPGSRTIGIRHATTQDLQGLRGNARPEFLRATRSVPRLSAARGSRPLAVDTAALQER